MLNKIITDFIKNGYFNTLSNISIDNSDKDNPISFFQSNKKYIDFDGEVIKNIFKDKQLRGCDLLTCKNNIIYLKIAQNDNSIRIKKQN